MAKSGGDFYNGVATTSLRFDDGSTAFLSRTPSSASNQKTWTWSGWVKRGDIGINGTIFEAAPDAGTTNIFYMAGAVLYLTGINSGTTVYDFILTQVFRDPSAWYHFVIAMDTTQSTASNRTKIYINGSIVTDFSTETNPSLNLDTLVNSDNAHSIGKRPFDTSLPWDGYMAEINFIDGLALTPTSFGETKNGVWIPIDTSGLTFGTNGFRLKFDQVGVGTASTSTIGADTSGNTNHFTSSGIVASDCAMPDSPENNFCTLNANRTGQVANLTNGALTYKDSNTGGPRASVGTFGATSGKWYFEIRLDNDLFSTMSGFMDVSIYAGSHLATDTNRGSGNLPWDERGYLADNNTLLSGYDYTTNDVVSFAVDIDAGKAFIRKNSDAFLGSGDPSDGSNPAHTFTAGQPMTPFIASYRSAVYTLNCGQDSTFGGQETATTHTDSNGQGTFHTAPPTGYLALCTANLPEPTIGANSDTQADNHFDVVLYTGNSGNKTISGLGFQPDWVWAKSRSLAQNHHIHDSARGVELRLNAEANNAEISDGELKTFTSDGFTFDTAGATNTNNATNVAWCWHANSGTATATISESGDNPAAVVQANPTAGFSLITYTGTGDAGTIAHGLGAVPTMMIIKNRDVADAWAVYHGANTAAPATDYLVLNTTAATADAATYWADTAPTSSVFTVHDAHSVNADGEKYVAYCFAEVEGYSKFGKYIGNGVVDGPFVYLGFRPAWIMVKSTTNTNSETNWVIWDNKRNGYNTAGNIQVFANQNYAEGQRDDNGGAGISDLDILSNGFKHRDATFGQNGVNGATFIYMAFAEAPFKYANAR